MNEIKDTALEDNIASVMRTLPPLIRDYIAQEKYAPVVRELAAKNKLRIDQGGKLETDVVLLLIGIHTPEEFIDSLEGAGFSHEAIDDVTREINKRIFVPLREQEENGDSAGAGSSAELAQPAPGPKPKLPAPAPMAQMKQVAVKALAPVLLIEQPKPTPPIVAPKPPAPPEPPKAIPRLGVPTEPTPKKQVVQASMAPKQPVPNPAPPSAVSPAPPKPKPAPITAYTRDPYREPIDDEEPKIG